MIKTLPNGRKPVEIRLVQENKMPYEKVLEAVKRGEQAYVVCPLIEENDSDTLKEVRSVEQVYKELTTLFAADGIVIDYISGG